MTLNRFCLLSKTLSSPLINGHNQAGWENTHPVYILFQVLKVLKRKYSDQVFFSYCLHQFLYQLGSFFTIFQKFTQHCQKKDFYLKFSFFSAFSQPRQTLKGQNVLTRHKFIVDACDINLMLMPWNAKMKFTNR